MFYVKRSAPWPWRAVVWEARECVTMGRDLWRSRTWPGWYKLPAWAAMLILGIPLLLIVTHYTGRQIVVGFVVLWAVTAGATGVVRRRHYLRMDLRDAASSITGGHQRRDPNEHQRKSKQPRPRMKWQPVGTANLKSAVVTVPGYWARGDDEKVDKLDTEIRRRLAHHGNYAIDWPHDQAVARLRRVFPLPRVVEAQHTWVAPRNAVLLGVTESCHHPGTCKHHTVTADGINWAPWDRTIDAHILAAGSTGRGKTTMLRWLIYSLILNAKARSRGVQIGALDGKGAGNLAFLENRVGVLGKGGFDEPDEWTQVVNSVKAEMDKRYGQLRRWNKNSWRQDPDAYPEPVWDDDVILVVDELVDIANIAGDDVIEPLSQICRQGREAGITVVCSVLRPDTVASLPGLVRDQLTARILLGAITEQTSARMVFQDDWRAARAIAGTGDGRIPGRGVVRLGDEMFRIQIPLTKRPAKDPRDAALWLPPRLPEGVADIAQARREIEPTPIDPRERRRLAEAETLEKS